MAKLYDLAVAVGRYTTRNGEEKKRWKAIGSIVETKDGGKVILIDRAFNPAGVPVEDGRDQIMVCMFEPKEEGSGNSASKPAQKQAPSLPAVASTKASPSCSATAASSPACPSSRRPGQTRTATARPPSHRNGRRKSPKPNTACWPSRQTFTRQTTGQGQAHDHQRRTSKFSGARRASAAMRGSAPR